MVDIFALALGHGLLALAAWRLIQRDDLDSDPVRVEVAPAVETPDMPRIRPPAARRARAGG